MKSLSQYIFEESNKSCSIDKAHSLFDEYFKNFKITDIPLSVRKKSIKDFEEIYNDYEIASESYLVDINPLIIETLKDDIASTKEAIQTLKEKYGMTDYYFKAIHPYNVQIVSVDKIPNYLATTNSVLLPLIKKNVDIIKKEMDDIGYYLVRETTRYDKETGCDWVLRMFDPKHQDDISTSIRNRCTILYHFSSADNHESIMKKGIIPKNDKIVYSYNSERVYLITVDPKHENFQKMLMNVYSNRTNKTKLKNDKYMLYMINTSRLPKDMKFYYDPHGANCVYTTETIPYSAIIDAEEIKF